MKLLKPHPIAELLPRMSDEDFHELVLSIEKNGFDKDEPIVMHEGKILDGRHRHAACLKTKRAPKYVDWKGEHGTPLDFVFAKNFARRHMNESQRAVAAARLLEYFEADAKKRMKAGTLAPHGARGKAAGFAAERLKSSARSVERAKRLLKEAPEAIEAIDAGKSTLGKAEASRKRDKQRAQAKAYEAPAGEHPVIVADPPWPYDDKLQGVERELPYPTMTLYDICALKVPAAPDCVLWLWVTNAHLIDGSAGKVLAAWGFEAKTMLTWAKDKIGMGRWLRGQTEHCLLAVKGSPTVDLTNQSTLLVAPRRANSEKPEEFFALVESMCPQGPKLEMFARAERKGWVTTGSELEAAPVKPAKARRIKDCDGSASCPHCNPRAA